MSSNVFNQKLRKYCRIIVFGLDLKGGTNWQQSGDELEKCLRSKQEPTFPWSNHNSVGYSDYKNR